MTRLKPSFSQAVSRALYRKAKQALVKTQKPTPK